MKVKWGILQQIFTGANFEAPQNWTKEVKVSQNRVKLALKWAELRGKFSLVASL